MNELDKGVLDPSDRWDARLLRLRKANRLRPAHDALRLLARMDAAGGADEAYRRRMAAKYCLNQASGSTAFEAWAAEAAALATQERAARRAQHDMEREAEVRRTAAEFEADAALAERQARQ